MKNVKCGRKGKRISHKLASLVKIYDRLEAIYARKGHDSLWPNQPFQHTFEDGAVVLGVSRGGTVKVGTGDLIIRSKRGKRLWNYFHYEDGG